jgi:hypothetical protein
MGQHYGPVPPAGEHTVLNAYACGCTDERLVLKTFLIPFGVYQKEFACRGETRPGGRAEAFEVTNRNGQVVHRQVAYGGETRPRDRERHPIWMFLPTELETSAIGQAIPQAQADAVAIE